MSPSDQNDWENDPVWNLLDEAKSPKAGPFFVRDVLREVRLSAEPAAPWWRQLFTFKPILAGSLATLAAAIIITVRLQDPAPVTVDAPQPVPGEAISSPVEGLDALVEEEILSQAAEDPTAFSDEALVALLY